MARDRRRDEDEEDDRPRAKRRRDEDDEEDAPRPKRKPRPADDEDEEERPRRRSRARDDEEDDEDDRPRRKPAKAGMSKGLLFGLIGGGAALVLVVVLLIVFLSGDGTVGGPPKAVFEAYVKDLRGGNTDRAVKYLSAKGRFELESDSRAAGLRPGDQLVREVAATRWFHQPFTVTDEKIDPSGTKATLPLRFDGNFGFGQSTTMEVDLVKEGSKWKIDF